MRNQLLKVSKGTKSERRISEIFKKNRIKFKFHQRIGRYEVDFVIGNIALEIDGSIHEHINQIRETYLFSQGYIVFHINAYNDFDKVEKELLYLIKNN